MSGANGYRFWHEKKYRMCLTMIEIEDGEISIRSNIPIDLDTTTANVSYIKAQLKRDLDIKEPVLLNSRFQEIFDSYSTRGDVYWNRGNKYYFIEKSEWTEFSANSERKCKSHHIKNKKINRPLEFDYVEKPASLYFPVTGPKTFRKVITWIKIQNREILLYKDVPYDLTEPTANIPTINQIIRANLGIPESIILDTKFKEVKDSATTRGEAFWKNSNKFYFIDRYEWERYDNSLVDVEFDRIKFRNIRHKTYFDKSRESYFKNV